MVSRPRAITCKMMTPTSRLPCSTSEMCPLFISQWTARSVCVHPYVFPQRLDAFPQLNQKNVSAARHALIVAILFAACVWHARHSLGSAQTRTARK